MKQQQRWAKLFLLSAMLGAGATQAAEAVQAPVLKLMQGLDKLAPVQRALAFIALHEPQTQQAMLAINAIPAPTFAEAQRANEIAARMRKLGLADVHIDEAGNVLGRLAGRGKGPTVALAAHLDTVYPMSTGLAVEEREGRLYAPGIADNARSLAAMLVVAEAMLDAGIVPDGDILFCANVGEEGMGDLKGVKHLFATHKEIKAFIGLEPLMGDDAHAAIINLATGSRRYQVSFHGPGGHSYEAFGLPSAIHALGRAVAHIDDLRPPADPKVTFSVGIIEGGQSVNSIAASASMMIDMRSEDAQALARMEADVMAAIARGVSETNQRWNSKAITTTISLIGDRPAGKMPVDSAIVQGALAAAAVIGAVPSLASAHSTDANLPMSQGIPAITLSAGGRASGLHAGKAEWWSAEQAQLGPQQIVLTLLGLAGYNGLRLPATLPK